MLSSFSDMSCDGAEQPWLEQFAATVVANLSSRTRSNQAVVKLKEVEVAIGQPTNVIKAHRNHKFGVETLDNFS